MSIADLPPFPSEDAPRVEDILNRAVAAQLAEQQAQRDAYSDLEGRLEAMEVRLLENASQVAEAQRSEDQGTGDELARRLDAMEAAVGERMALLESSVRDDAVGDRLGSIERALEEGLSILHSELIDSTEKRLQAIEDAIGTRLGEMEASVRQFQEETSARLDQLREAHTAAEAGILERIIAESQVVGAHFEAVRPAVEAAAQAGPDLENTLEELRKIADTVSAAGDGSDSPYSAAELNAPHHDEEHHESLFLPPEETPIPERRFGILPRRDR
jgi:hypothetical protein